MQKSVSPVIEWSAFNRKNQMDHKNQTYRNYVPAFSDLQETPHQTSSPRLQNYQAAQIAIKMSKENHKNRISDADFARSKNK